MKAKLAGAVLVAFVVYACAGCAHVISKEVRSQVDESISFKQVFQSPDAYKGKVVLWGGVIINTTHQKDGTLIEVLQKTLDTEGKPEDADRSEGRFLLFDKRFLDDALFSKGRRVTVAGEVIGKRVMPVGETEYAYPFISNKEIHLWPDRAKEMYAYPPPYWYYPGWYDPWWGPWYDPWWPWWGPHHRHWR